MSLHFNLSQRPRGEGKMGLNLAEKRRRINEVFKDPSAFPERLFDMSFSKRVDTGALSRDEVCKWDKKLERKERKVWMGRGSRSNFFPNFNYI